MRKDIIPTCVTKHERGLLEIYNMEIENHHQGGSLAVASDILRWLKPIYTLGIYSDFDVDINTKNLPVSIYVSVPFLLNAGTVLEEKLHNGDKIHNGYSNNNLFAVVNKEHPLIEKIQLSIYNAYKRPQYDVEKLRSKSMSLLLEISQGKSSLEIRKFIMQITENNFQFVKFIASTKEELLESLLSKKIILQAKLLLKNNPSMPNSSAFDSLRSFVRHKLLFDCIMNTAGPSRISQAISPFAESSNRAEDILRHSFSRYAVISPKNQMLMGMTQEEYMENGAGDLSWLAFGVESIKTKEVILNNSAKKITQFFIENKSNAHRMFSSAHTTNYLSQFKACAQKISQTHWNWFCAIGCLMALYYLIHNANQLKMVTPESSPQTNYTM